MVGYHGRKIIEYWWYLVDVDGLEMWVKKPTETTYKEVLKEVYKAFKPKKAWIKKSGYYYYEE